MRHNEEANEAVKAQYLEAKGVTTKGTWSNEALASLLNERKSNLRARLRSEENSANMARTLGRLEEIDHLKLLLGLT